MNQVKILFFITVSLFFSCLGEPQRTNPLDPESHLFSNNGVVSGTTLTMFTFAPVGQVEVFLAPGGSNSLSDNKGRFFFNNIPAGDYRVLASKDGFSTVADSVVVQPGAETTVQLHLNALPLVDSAYVVSRHIAKPFPAEHNYLFEVTAYLSDQDGFADLQTPLIQIPSLNNTDTMSATSTFGVFQLIMEQPQATLENMIGHRIFVLARDRNGAAELSQPHTLARVIVNTPQDLAPGSGDNLNDRHPALTWKAVVLPFKFSYEVEVIRIFQIGVETIQWTQPAIDQTKTSIRVTPALSNGNYRWALTIVDEFGNRSRSLEATFQINVTQ